MASMADEVRNEDTGIGGRVGLQETIDHAGREERQISGREQPGIVIDRMAIAFDLLECREHRGLHVGGINDGPHDGRSRAGGRFVCRDIIGSRNDEDLVDRTASPGGKHLLQHRGTVPGQQQLGLLHAAGLPGGGYDGITAKLAHGRLPLVSVAEETCDTNEFPARPGCSR